jgi:hypothetical protein
MPFEYGLMNPVILGFAAASIAFQHAVAERAVGRSALQALFLAPFSIALAIGLSATYTVALAYGLRDRAGEFHRTPKVSHPPGSGEPIYRAKRSVLVVFEVLIGLAYSFFTVLAVERGFFLEACFLAFVAFAFLWVGVGSMRVSAFPARRVGARGRSSGGAREAKSEDRLPADSVPKT